MSVRKTDELGAEGRSFSSLDELEEALLTGALAMPCGKRCRPLSCCTWRLDGWLRVRCPDHNVVFLIRPVIRPGRTTDEIEIETPYKLQPSKPPQ